MSQVRRSPGAPKPLVTIPLTTPFSPTALSCGTIQVTCLLFCRCSSPSLRGTFCESGRRASYSIHLDPRDTRSSETYWIFQLGSRSGKGWQQWPGNMVGNCQFRGFSSHTVDYRAPGTVDTGVLHLKLPGTEMVVLSTSEAVSDLLDQRSVIYSDKVRAHRPIHIESQSLTVFFKPCPPMIEL